ncbi:MAG: 50S ribosomal protein L20 [Candidatus Gracilibacteria bacterium]|nr:50S ribosomal protein L20 [Candidatus Gracilibacteria bacterium]MDD2908741.1 50S ribosomal protein L20 [Candidatus Gracilibacteria bacterium]
MTRVTRGLGTKKRHKNLLARVKGFRMMNGNVFSRAKNALAKAGTNAFIGRKLKKRDFRSLWTIRINIAARQHELSYSKFINLLNIKKVKLDRKALSNIAIAYPEVFKNIVDFVK